MTKSPKISKIFTKKLILLETMSKKYYNRRMGNIILVCIAVLSLVNFVVYGIDKLKAKNNSYRIPEKILLGLSFLGGALGGVIAMNLFRHKTKHWYFWVINVLSLIIHIIVLVYFFLK